MSGSFHQLCTTAFPVKFSKEMKDSIFGQLPRQALLTDHLLGCLQNEAIGVVYHRLKRKGIGNKNFCVKHFAL